MEFNKAKLDELIKKLRKEQGIEDSQKPFFSFSRDVFHKREPCYFCGFTGNLYGEGRYIYSPLADLEDVDEKEIMKSAIFFCGKCQEKIEDMEVLDMDFG